MNRPDPPAPPMSPRRPAHDLAPPRVVAAPLQPGAEAERLQDRDEPPRPPRLADVAAPAARPQAALHRTRPARTLAPPDEPVLGVHRPQPSALASADSATSSRRRAVDSSVSH